MTFNCTDMDLKMCLSEQQDTNKDEISIQGKRPDSPTDSCESLNSDSSMEQPIHSKYDNCSTIISQTEGKRPDSPEDSCVSMKSDSSMRQPMHIKDDNSSTSISLNEGKRPNSPEASCVSMKSDWSMEQPIRFQDDNCPTNISLIQGKRTDSSEVSCVSMKSDWSMKQPISFQDNNCSTNISLNQDKRPNSPEVSCVSMKSDSSMRQPMHFKNDNCSTNISPIQGKRPDSPEASCVSMKSHWSMEQPIRFKNNNCSTNISLNEGKRPDSPEVSCVSMKSDSSMRQPMHFKNDNCSTNISPIQGKRPDSPEASCVSMKSHWSMEQPIRFKNNNCSTNIRLQNRTSDDEDTKSTKKEPKNIKQQELNMVSVYQQKLKSKLEEKFKRLNEGTSQHGSPILLNEIFTELYITETWSGEVNSEHEVRQIEMESRRPTALEKPIKCNDLFKDKSVRTVLTKGVAGIGKTVSVQKFILDWAEGKANQDVTFMFPLPFRELNLIKLKKLSLMDLLCMFFPEVKELNVLDCDAYNVIFIFDGLDECRLPLTFQDNERLCDVTESTSVDVMLTNLIKRNLLPSAHVWITCRPAAAGQIPFECVNLVTEVRGFSNPQKEDYFRKKIRDENLASKIITYMKSSRSLYIMCHIPVFCWILASVVERMLDEAESREIPKSLTRMFTHFLIFQIKHKDQKYPNKCDVDPQQMFLALGKLAFQQLEKGNLIFYEKDLQECGIDVKEVLVYSGVCTQIFREEYGLHLGKVFCFVHLSVQEFLAALYAFICFVNKNQTEQQITDLSDLFNKSSMSDFLKSAVDRALQSKNGHLDLFLRFLLGLSQEFNQSLLQELVPHTAGDAYNKEETVMHIKNMISENPSSEKFINLLYCLIELNDHSLVQEVQTFLNQRQKGLFSSPKRKGCLSGDNLSPAQWSALVFVLLDSEEREEFTFRRSDQSDECLLRLLPVFEAYRRVGLHGCNLTETSCSILSRALNSNFSHVKELNLSNNKLLQDLGVKQLSVGLKSPHCKLETLRLDQCNLKEESCAVLASFISLEISCLKELNLSENPLQDSGVKLLCTGLKNPHCKLEILRLHHCSLTKESCEDLSSVLSLDFCMLKELNLSFNKLEDSGMKLLSVPLEKPDCKLEKLGLEMCNIADEGCVALLIALTSNPSSKLRELNMQHNLKDVFYHLIYYKQFNPQCKLTKIL